MHIFKYSNRQAISMPKLYSVQGTQWGGQFNGPANLQDYMAPVVGKLNVLCSNIGVTLTGENRHRQR
jgi:hypothetical protein